MKGCFGEGHVWVDMLGLLGVMNQPPASRRGTCGGAVWWSKCHLPGRAIARKHPRKVRCAQEIEEHTVDGRSPAPVRNYWQL